MVNKGLKSMIACMHANSSMCFVCFQELFAHETAEPTVLILPDINADIMSLILDYIYTGSVGVYSQTLPEFLSVANFFQLQIDEKFSNYGTTNGQQSCNNPEFNNANRMFENCLNAGETFVKKVPRKVPNLMPIAAFQNKFSKARKGLYNSVIPSPWCPRLAPLLVDPRKDCIGHTELPVSRFCFINQNCDHTLSKWGFICSLWLVK